MDQKIEEIMQDVRNLRDSDLNPCMSEKNGECTCGPYDEILDKLEALKDKKLLELQFMNVPGKNQNADHSL